MAESGAAAARAARGGQGTHLSAQPRHPLPPGTAGDSSGALRRGSLSDGAAPAAAQGGGASQAPTAAGRGRGLRARTAPPGRRRRDGAKRKALGAAQAADSAAWEIPGGGGGVFGGDLLAARWAWRCPSLPAATERERRPRIGSSRLGQPRASCGHRAAGAPRRAHPCGRDVAPTPRRSRSYLSSRRPPLAGRWVTAPAVRPRGAGAAQRHRLSALGRGPRASPHRNAARAPRPPQPPPGGGSSARGALLLFAFPPLQHNAAARWAARTERTRAAFGAAAPVPCRAGERRGLHGRHSHRGATRCGELRSASVVCSWSVRCEKSHQVWFWRKRSHFFFFF